MSFSDSWKGNRWDIERGNLNIDNDPWKGSSSSSLPSQQELYTNKVIADIISIQKHINIVKNLLAAPFTENVKNRLCDVLHTTTQKINEIKPSILSDKSVKGKKIARDFSILLQEFKDLSIKSENLLEQQTNKLVAQVETIENMSVPNEETSNLLLQDQLTLENEIDFNETMIMERERDIEEITYGISEINEIFTTLGRIVGEQGGMIDNIENNVDNIAVSTKAATEELGVASTHQRKSRKFLCWIFVILFLVLMLLVLILNLT